MKQTASMTRLEIFTDKLCLNYHYPAKTIVNYLRVASNTQRLRAGIETVAEIRLLTPATGIAHPFPLYVRMLDAIDAHPSTTKTIKKQAGEITSPACF